MAEFEVVGRADDLTEGEMQAFDVGGTQIAVANVAGEFHAFGDTCTHLQCSLAEQPREVPHWIFRFMPYALAVMMGDHRISNAKARRELGWTPSAPTYREGISRLVQALGGRGWH